MPAVDLKQQIEQSLAAFADQPLAEAARGLFATLGYKSERRVQLRPATAAGFLTAFDPQGSLDRGRALVSDWAAVEFLFQLTDAEVQAAGGQLSLFESAGVFDGAIMESYVFLAIELRGPQERSGERAGRTYTRSEMAGVIREVNRLFTMPAMVLFRHGDSLSLGVVKRRLHKRDSSKDVQGKVTLIKDITAADPLRAHLDIRAGRNWHRLTVCLWVWRTSYSPIGRAETAAEPPAAREGPGGSHTPDASGPREGFQSRPRRPEGLRRSAARLCKVLMRTDHHAHLPGHEGRVDALAGHQFRQGGHLGAEGPAAPAAAQHRRDR